MSPAWLAGRGGCREVRCPAALWLAELALGMIRGVRTANRSRREHAVTSSAAAPRQRLTPDQRNSFIAAQLGWTMDAFDYFIVLFVYADIAKSFSMQKD